MNRERGKRTAKRAVGLFLAPTFLFAVGCRGNCDLVEAELRTREHQMRELRCALDQTEAFNAGLQRELWALRQAGGPVPPEAAGAVCGLTKIALGRQTGGYDVDRCEGDDALQVVVEPRDADDHTIKAPGALQVTALQIDSGGVKVPLSTWDVNPEQIRRTWKSGFLGNGYQVVLPWKNPPTTDKLRVVARFTLADGRVFEADKDVTLRLAPTVKPRTLPGPPLEEVLPGPILTEPLAAVPSLWKPNAGLPHPAPTVQATLASAPKKSGPAPTVVPLSQAVEMTAPAKPIR